VARKTRDRGDVPLLVDSQLALAALVSLCVGEREAVQVLGGS
jgi:hypothetical protein